MAIQALGYSEHRSLGLKAKPSVDDTKSRQSQQCIRPPAANFLPLHLKTAPSCFTILRAARVTTTDYGCNANESAISVKPWHAFYHPNLKAITQMEERAAQAHAQPRRGSSLSLTNIRSPNVHSQCRAMCRIRPPAKGTSRRAGGSLQACGGAAGGIQRRGCGSMLNNTDASLFSRQFRVVGFALVLRPTMGRGGFSIIPPRRIAGALHALQFGMTARHA